MSGKTISNGLKTPMAERNPAFRPSLGGAHDLALPNTGDINCFGNAKGDYFYASI